ncbi:MAG: hypothetical protein JNN33_16120 [Rhodospirillaceae bacterium]|jgi:hypothetical protein|nr:hypothetical protein [Rhodospirillaceae bacterium]
MARRSIPEIRAGLAQQERLVRSLAQRMRNDRQTVQDKEKKHEQNLVHHGSFPWHWRGTRQGGLGVR